MRFGTGINTAGELVDLGSTHGLLEKSGAWYQLDGERIAQGRDKACEFLQQQPEIADALRARLVQALQSVRPVTPPVSADKEADETAESAAA